MTEPEFQQPELPPVERLVPEPPAAEPSSPEPQLLQMPADGVPDVVVDPAGLRDVVAALAAGTGPVAVDAERASGYRYGQRAFLVQLRRSGSGTHLLDPVGVPDMSALLDAIGDVEWVLHAAGQDLPCLAELGLVPRTVFDTELAARLAGLPRVGLGAVVEELLGLRLAKEHSAVDWSTRPLPEPWLRYAALDVEVLVDLRDRLVAVLAEQGKTEWAAQEFAAVVAAEPPPPRVDPWRRTNTLHRLRNRRQLAQLRELWAVREEMARRRDVSPGRIVPDKAMVEAVIASPASVAELVALPVFGGRSTKRHAVTFLNALNRGRSLPEDALPAHALPTEGPPPVRVWTDRDPDAAARLSASRALLGGIAAQHSMPVENLLQPDALRRLCWEPPVPLDATGIEAHLRERGARRWQMDVVTPGLLTTLTATAPPAPPAAAVVN